jgi:hypothetical protein
MGNMIILLGKVFIFRVILVEIVQIERLKAHLRHRTKIEERISKEIVNGGVLGRMD